MVLLLDKIIIWVNLDLSIELNVSVLFVLEVSTILLDACDFSDLLTLSILFLFWNRMSDGILHQIRFWFFKLLSQ